MLAVIKCDVIYFIYIYIYIRPFICKEKLKFGLVLQCLYKLFGSFKFWLPGLSVKGSKW